MLHGATMSTPAPVTSCLSTILLIGKKPVSVKLSFAISSLVAADRRAEIPAPDQHRAARVYINEVSSHVMDYPAGAQLGIWDDGDGG